MTASSIVVSLRCEWEGRGSDRTPDDTTTSCWDYAKEVVYGKLYCGEHADEMRELLEKEKRDGGKS